MMIWAPFSTDQSGSAPHHPGAGMIAGDSKAEVNEVRLQTPFLLALADEHAKVFWHALSEPADAIVRMLPGARHCKRNQSFYKAVASSHCFCLFASKTNT
jgi:hypothetical protein